MQGWFDLVPATRAEPNPPTCRAFPKKRLKGFEPSTFCMASRRSSQLSYSRIGRGFYPFAGQRLVAMPMAR